MASHKAKRGRGRPPRIAEHPTTNFVLRLTDDERSALESHAEAREMSKAEVAREALENAGLFKMAKSKSTKSPRATLTDGEPGDKAKRRKARQEREG